MEVGVKSGTAQTGLGINHTTYGGFAPFDDPQIAVYVIVPFGDTPYLRAPAGHILRSVFESYFGFDQQPEENGVNDNLVR
jgi:cell division protein FtsI/penicillin-binding protein 2